MMVRHTSELYHIYSPIQQKSTLCGLIFETDTENLGIMRIRNSLSLHVGDRWVVVDNRNYKTHVASGD
jgi:hypothetical protein